MASAEAIEFAWERQARSREGGDFAEVAKAVIAGEFEKAGRLIKANAEAYANRLLEEIKRGESDERPLDCAGYFTDMDKKEGNA